MPTRADAISYGQLIIDIVREQIDRLKALDQSAVNAVVADRLHMIRLRAEAVGAGTMSMPTVTSLNNGEPDKDSLADHIEKDSEDAASHELCT